LGNLLFENLVVEGIEKVTIWRCVAQQAISKRKYVAAPRSSLFPSGNGFLRHAASYFPKEMPCCVAQRAIVREKWVAA